MRRLHLVELEDCSWMPAAIRDGVTDFLQFAVVKPNLYGRIVPLLNSTLERSGQKQVVDLCAGGGGAWEALIDQLPLMRNKGITVTLTDLYPNLETFKALSRESGGRLTFHPESVSAVDVPSELPGFRTLFSSFHHFRPESARAILRDAVNSGTSIAVFESTQRHLLLIIYMLFTPILVLLTTPFIRPFRWSRLFWTYLLPAIPLTVMFDGIVSCLRTYTPDELNAMAEQVEQESGVHYSWQTGVRKIGLLPVGVTYLIGEPAGGISDNGTGTAVNDRTVPA